MTKSYIPHSIIIILLLIVVYQNHSSEKQVLIWLDDIETRVKSIETYLMIKDPSYKQTK